LAHDEAIYDTIKKLRKAEIMPDELKLTPQAMTGIKSFIESMEELKENLAVESPSDFIESLIKKINYKDYLVKEE
jgi:superfamily I DNA/RNA helicase